ncbi:MAG TPA: hypothetical protein VE197_11315, partial [Mycobacterium sp.]|nr:hypothetical protein [Mycobacterium sp.]
MTARKRRFAAGGIAVGLIAAALSIGATMPAYGAAALTVSPDTGLTNGQSVTVSGNGFAASST